MIAALASIALLFLQALSKDPLVDKVWGVVIAAVVGQAVVLGLGLIGFVAVARRFMDKEVPAQLAAIDENMKSMDKHMEEVGKELVQMRRDLDRHGYQIETLEQWRRDQEGRARSEPASTRRR